MPQILVGLVLASGSRSEPALTNHNVGCWPTTPFSAVHKASAAIVDLATQERRRRLSICIRHDGAVTPAGIRHAPGVRPPRSGPLDFILMLDLPRTRAFTGDFLV